MDGVRSVYLLNEEKNHSNRCSRVW